MERLLGGRRVLVIDGAIPSSERAGLYDWCLRLPYYFADSDRPDTRHVKHMVHRLEAGGERELLEHVRVYAERQLKAGGFAYGGLRRAYVNFELFGDVQFAHEDGPCWTVLAFMNERWEVDWGGELLLYEAPDQPALAVQPLPGRMVLFDGRVLHRGGVPSKLCLEPRISLAIKYDRTAP